MNINAVYEKKRQFVNSLNQTLSVMPDFEAIEYTRDAIQGDEYIRIKDKIGYAYYINVTGNSEAAILQEVSRMMLGQTAFGAVTSTDRKREIAPMFRGR